MFYLIMGSCPAAFPTALSEARPRARALRVRCLVERKQGASRAVRRLPVVSSSDVAAVLFQRGPRRHVRALEQG